YWLRGLSSQSITARESSESVDGAGRCGAVAAGGVCTGVCTGVGSRRSLLGAVVAVWAGGVGAGRAGGATAGAGGAGGGAGDETAGVCGGVTCRTTGLGRLSAGGAAGGATAAGGRVGSGARSTSGVDTVGALLIGGATLISGARTLGVEDSPTGARPASFGLAVNGVPGFRGATADGGRLAGIGSRTVGCDGDEPSGSKA